MKKPDRRHGSPYDRGSADRYYGRPANPHFYAGDTYSTDKFDKHSMSDEEIAEYYRGYEEEEDRKDWGNNEVDPEPINWSII
jgi:hypothetical protein|tara:strand:+ start:9429 stop:9674 length:246 start_codon:yes stop_codon:yes gene_type:complete